MLISQRLKKTGYKVLRMLLTVYIQKKGESKRERQKGSEREIIWEQERQTERE